MGASLRKRARADQEVHPRPMEWQGQSLEGGGVDTLAGEASRLCRPEDGEESLRGFCRG